MNQIKQKIKEIGLSQREISKRLGKNASYLAGVFRSGLSTAKQAELLELLDIVSNGGAVQSDDEIIADLSEKLAKAQDLMQHNADCAHKYLNGWKEEVSHLKDWINSKDDKINRLKVDLEWKGEQLTQTQKYLMVANQEVEQIESKYRFVLIFNYVLSLVILGIVISWVLA
jgi:transcriptional regulator with XRE-family HTH domain